MATEEDVRRIALSLPEATEGEGRLSFSVAGKGFAWSWAERIHPKKARVENRDVLAVRVENEDEKQALIAADPDKFFTEDHYNGYPAVLIRLAAIDTDELQDLLIDAWRDRAPGTLTARFDIDSLTELINTQVPSG